MTPDTAELLKYMQAACEDVLVCSSLYTSMSHSPKEPIIL